MLHTVHTSILVIHNFKFLHVAYDMMSTIYRVVRKHCCHLLNTFTTCCRNMLMRGFHLLVMLVVGDKVKDTQCGFKVNSDGFAFFALCTASWDVVLCVPWGGYC